MVWSPCYSPIPSAEEYSTFICGKWELKQSACDPLLLPEYLPGKQKSHFSFSTGLWVKGLINFIRRKIPWLRLQLPESHVVHTGPWRQSGGDALWLRCSHCVSDPLDLTERPIYSGPEGPIPHIPGHSAPPKVSECLFPCDN